MRLAKGENAGPRPSALRPQKSTRASRRMGDIPGRQPARSTGFRGGGRQLAGDDVDTVAEAGPLNRREIEAALAAAVEARVGDGLGGRGVGIELHAVGLNP